MTEEKRGRKPDEKQEKILKTVRQFCEENGLFGGCRAVCAGVSGGADSVCLLFVLRELFMQMPSGIRPALTVVHVHHGIRGAEADADAQFTRDLCARLGVPFVMKKVDAPAFAKARKLSLEEAARQLRYAALREAAGGCPIAVAHTASDQAETVLFRLVRGTGVRGLAGMRPKTGDIIRPLLCITRQETESYLAAQGQPFVTDSTNFGRGNARSILRADVFPGLTQLNEQAVRHIAQAADQIGQTEALLDEMSRNLETRAKRDTGEGLMLDIRTLLAAPEVVRNRVLLAAMAQTAGHERDLQAVHVRAVCDLMREETGAMCLLPYGVRARREYDCIHFFREKGEVQQETLQPGKLSDGDCRELVNGGRVLKICGPWRAEFALVANFLPDADNEYTKFFDYDKIKNGLLLRNAAEGDFMRTGKTSRASIGKVLKDRKVLKEYRKKVLVLASGDEVYWAVGVRRSEAALVTEQTRRILRVSVTGQP